MRTVFTTSCVILACYLSGCIGVPGDMNDNAMNDNGANDNGDARPTTFAATLTGGAQVPAIESDASGSATFDVDETTGIISYRIDVANGTGIVQAHIHIGASDENGPVVAFLFGAADPAVDVDGELIEGSLTADDLINDLDGAPLSDLVDALIAGNAYVNVHSEANASGEVRGQIAAN